MGHRKGAAVGLSGHHGEHTTNQWMPGCKDCRLNDRRETHVWVEGQSACFLGAAGEIWRALANPMTHGRGIHQECTLNKFVGLWAVGCLIRGCLIRGCLIRGCLIRGCLIRGCLIRG